MDVKVIPFVLAHGYGISFRQLKVHQDEDSVSFVFPDKLSKGDFLLGYDEKSKAVVPMIRIGNEVTICVAFAVYVPDVGWKNVDIPALPGNLDELEHVTSFDTWELKLTDPAIDMSGYEIIKSWEV